jgi:hypothetical protein
MPKLPPKATRKKTTQARCRVSDFWGSRRWKNIRDDYKAKQPICERCVYLKCVTKDSCRDLSVHHIRRVETHWHLRDREENFLTLCNGCHYGYFSTLERNGNVDRAELEGMEIKER